MLSCGSKGYITGSLNRATGQEISAYANGGPWSLSLYTSKPVTCPPMDMSRNFWRICLQFNLHASSLGCVILRPNVPTLYLNHLYLCSGPKLKCKYVKITLVQLLRYDWKRNKRPEPEPEQILKIPVLVIPTGIIMPQFRFRLGTDPFWS